MGRPVFELLTRFIFIAISFMVTPLKGQCIDSERDALLMFKQGFHSHSDHFLSWVAQEDCCKWRGVRCNNRSGNVIALDLRNLDSSMPLQGQLGKSLLDLPYLSYLDLSHNDFCQTQIPEFIGSLSNSKYLNLSHGNFKGNIPSQLGNLSTLQSLDLSTGKSSLLRASTLHWLSGLSSLKILYLNRVYLNDADNWLDAVNKLPFLVKLHLSNYRLHNLPQSIVSVNFTLLEVLDLSYNNFYSMIPNWLVHISPSLRYLNLENCELKGSIPQAFVNFTSLVVLDLSYNYINGSIPYNAGNMTSLAVLDLSNNHLEGPIPPTLGLIQELHHFKCSSLRKLLLSGNNLNGSLETINPHLSELAVLDVASNSLNGLITEAHLQNFSSLKIIDLSDNQLILNVSSNWVPDFQLETIGLGSCKMGPKFPQWLQNQKKCLKLDMHNTSLSGTLPDWFWDLCPSMKHLDLSWNRLGGKLPSLSTRTSMLTLDLSHNEFTGDLPHFPSTIQKIELSYNQFSGSISPICDMMNESNVLGYLSVYVNLLSGSLPNCWKHCKNLFHLDLGSNHFSGQIPESIGHLDKLKNLYLDNNTFSGEIPQSLQNWRSLILLDLDYNSLSGSIPIWLGENMQYLSLSNNAFQGNIPLQLCQLRQLLFLDISSNSVSGRIPPCINNFLPVADKQAEPFWHDYTLYTKDEQKQRMWIDSQNIKEHRKLLDLFSNRLSGEIPREVTELIRLQYLNLSNNHLIGTIPCDIGALKSLQFLDLSRNQLSHTIPPTISNLPLLHELNLSHNNLSGKVPPTPNNFSAHSFVGNHNLCGSPLTHNCSMDYSLEDETECSTNGESSKHKNNGIQHKEDSHGFEETPSFYISLPIGFATGFWGFWATLVFNKSWRHAYFRFLTNMDDKIYVFVVVSMAMLRRKFHKEPAL